MATVAPASSAVPTFTGADAPSTAGGHAHDGDGRKRPADCAIGNDAKRVDVNDAAKDTNDAEIQAMNLAESKYRAAQLHYFRMLEYAESRPGLLLAAAAADAGADPDVAMPRVDAGQWRAVVAFHLADWKEKHTKFLARIGCPDQSRLHRAKVFETHRQYSRFWK